ncbi:MAG TPA: signal peptidase II [Polyangiaceae bacterium]
MRFGRSSTMERLALACLLGGAAGNALDRWRWGYVVDFIRIEYWPTFNFADVALTLGALLMFVSAWQKTKAREAAASQTVT